MQGELFGIWWLWWLLGTVGIGGIIALAVLAPAVASVVLQWCLRFFLGTRVGVGLLVGAIAFVGADIHRSRLDQREWDAKTANAEQERKDRDADIAKKTREAVTKELADQKAADTATEKQVEDFSHALPPVPETGNPFVVGADACKLRQIAGLSCRGLEGTATPMPKPNPSRRRR